MPPRSSPSTVPSNPLAARTAAIALLARRDFTCRELREKLIGRGFKEATAASVVAELARELVLDDGRCAQNYVAHHAGRGQGPLRIAAELRRRGIAADLIDTALATGPDWSALACKVLRAKFGRPP